MKVQNTSIYMGNDGKFVVNGLKKDGEMQNDLSQTDKSKQKGSVFGGNLNNITDSIAEKKQKAREQAMKIVGDAWAGEQKIDADMEARRARIKELQSEIGTCNQEIQWFEEERARLQEVYGVAEDSKEQRDLELLAKEVDAKTPGKQVSLSKEEREQIEAIKAKGLTEYQSRSLELKELARGYEEQKYKLSKEIETENAIISATRIERLKSNPMEDARKQADKVMEEAGKEIVGMVLEEGLDHVDEKLEEQIEEAKERAEKKEEQEEIPESAAALIDVEAKQAEVQKELKEVMDKVKLLAEDIKGMKVDETV